MNSIATEESSAFVDNRLLEWMNIVNENDVSKGIDENGEPLVVHHWTEEFGFTSDTLRGIGIVGIRYDGRQDGECVVVFDENDVEVVDVERWSLAHPAGREGYTLDKNGKIIYNNKTTEEIRNGYTNEFRRIQELTDRGREKTRDFHFEPDLLHRAYPRIERRVLGRLSELVSRLSESGQCGYVNGVVVGKENAKWEVRKAVPATVFHDIFKICHNFLYCGDLVDVHTIEDYRNATCYLSDDGVAGFAIGADGDLISVFNLNSQKRGWVGAVRDMLIREGATHLDCYMSPLQPLHAIYANKFGAKTTSELAFNEDFVSKEFADHYERPSVAFMVLPPIANKPIEKKQFSKDDYDKAKAYQMSFVAHAQNIDTKFSLNGLYNPMEEIYDKARHDKFIKDKTNEELEALNTAATNYDSLLKIAQQAITLACWQVRNKRDNAPNWVINRLTKNLNDAERAIAVERAQMTYEIIKNRYGEIPDPSAENAITAVNCDKGKHKVNYLFLNIIF